MWSGALFWRYRPAASCSAGRPTCRNPPALWPSLCDDDLHALNKASKALTPADWFADQVHWFPGYGCALLTLHEGREPEHGICATGDVPLILVGLDKWSFATHTCVTITGVLVPSPHAYQRLCQATSPGSELSCTDDAVWRKARCSTPLPATAARCSMVAGCRQMSS